MTGAGSMATRVAQIGVGDEAGDAGTEIGQATMGRVAQVDVAGRQAETGAQRPVLRQQETGGCARPPSAGRCCRS